MEFFGLRIELWIVGFLAVVSVAVYLWYRVKLSNILLKIVLPVLYELYERRSIRSIDVMGIVQSLRKAGHYPSHIPLFFIKNACEMGIKKGWIVRRGYAGYQISPKGRTEVDQTLGENEWRRRGKENFPA